MSTKRIIELLARYEEGACTETEKALIDQWFAAHGAPESSFEQMDSDEQQKWIAALFEDINQSNKITSVPSVKRLWPRVVVAAASVAVMTLGVWLYYTSSLRSPRHPEFISGSPLANDVAPGKNTATLTLANGKVIKLSDAKTGVVIGDKLAYNDGAEIPDQVRHDEVQMLTASTPRGGQYQVVLPDGTKVWLNADSKIFFPSQFSDKYRRISVEGEAYFEVAKDKEHPFIVVSDYQEIEVLGTHFNVNTYSEEPAIKTTLLEGSLRVLSTNAHPTIGSVYKRGSKPEVILKPGQQSVLKEEELTVKEVNDAEASIAWKNGEFIFSDEPLESIMRKLARWYDVEVVYKDIDPKTLFYGSMSRYDQISKVLSKLELTGGIHFKIEGRKIIVTK